VSTANVVPETWELSGDDAVETLRSTGRWRLVSDAFQRMRAADGFSHARSLAFMITLVLVQGIIAIVGLAAALGNGAVADAIVRAIHDAVPGPAGDVLTAAVDQAREAGSSQRYLALVLGSVGALVSATTAMGQLERGLNRLYGVEQDRPTLQKYSLAFGLALTAGALGAMAFVALAFGRSIGEALDNDSLSSVWDALRWPLALALLVAMVALLFRWSPRRRQPAWSWMAFGAMVSVGLLFLVTILLAVLFRASTSFGETYGPLAGIVALQLWALLSAIGLFLGAAVAAQLEAVRAGARQPQDAAKVAESRAALSPEPAIAR
jgi:YihY family inner membrane protein